MKFEGAYAAMVTPFTDKDDINVEGMRSNVEYLSGEGIAGLVPCGSTGESATLTSEEHKKLIDITIDAASVPVVAGTGSNNTAEAVELTRYAQDAGADAALLIVPYYNKPTRAGLVRHFGAIADATEIPLILYNIPGRTAINMDAETVSVLAHEHDNVAGIKEASANFSQISDVVERTCDLDFSVLSGDDGLTLPMMALGATGVISVTADIFPRRMIELVQLCLGGKFAEARKAHYQLSPLFRALFIETNPIPVKKACDLIGLAGGPLRLPLTEMTAANVTTLEKTLASYRE